MTTAEPVTGAVDIGGTKIAVGLVDANGRVLARADLPTEPARSFEAALQRVSDGLGRLLRQVGRTLGGIGIGATGPIDPATGTFGVVPFFPHWQGASPVAFLAEVFGVTAAAENDADAAALGEAAHGAGRDACRFLFITVGTGIGGGIVLDGRLYRGAGGAHPELGHIIVEASGPDCTCGGRGCWEALAAGPALAAWYAAQAGPGLTAREVCERARQGEAAAVRAVEREAEYLGVGLASLITTFGPDLVALGGSVMDSYDLMAATVQRVVGERCTLVPWQRDTIRPARLGVHAGLVGAAEVWRHRFEKGHEPA